MDIPDGVFNRKLVLVPPEKYSMPELESNSIYFRGGVKKALEILERDEIFEVCAVLRDYLNKTKEEPMPDSYFDYTAIYAQIILCQVGYYTTFTK